MLIEGIFAAITTPFYPDERVYFRKLEANIARYSRSLLAGMVVLGSTGEAVELDDAETRDVLRTAADAAAAEKVLIAGISRESVKATVELAEAAAQYNYDAVLVRTPTYYSPQMNAEAVLTYFRSVADRSPLPVVLYNIPRLVPYPIPVEIVAELAQHPNIIGIKDSCGSLDNLKAILAATSNAPRRTVTVTPVFEAVTARMLKPAPPLADASTLVSATDLAGGVAVAAAPPAPAIKTRTRGSRLPGAYRLSRHHTGSAGSRSIRRHSWLCSVRTAGLPGSLFRMEGPRSEACRGQAAAHHGAQPTYRE